MTVRIRKKSSRSHGSQTHGWGSKKKHRGAGNRGGKGMAGTGKRAGQKKPSILKEFGTAYFGKFGFKRPNIVKISTINISFLEEHLEKLLKKEIIKKEKDFYAMNLKDLNADKLLGKGAITKKFKITARLISKNAEEKIKKAGGEIIADKESARKPAGS